MTNSSESSSFFALQGEERSFCAWVRVLLNCGIGGAICLLGIVGNLLAYIILNRGLSAPVAIFLLRCLAVTDNFFLTVWLINIPLRDLFRHINYNSLAWRYARLYSYPLLYIAQFVTIWLTVLIAAIRYIGMCKPYLSRKLCSIENVKLAILILYLIAIVYNLPLYFEAQIKPVNGTMWLVDTWLGKNIYFRIIYSQVSYYLFTFALPLLILSILNIRLIIAYRHLSERRRRRSLTSRRPSKIDEANFTLVMIVIIAVFVICQLPARLVQIIWSYRFKSCRSARFYLMELSTLLEVLNSSVNFIIYCFLRPQFRQYLTSSFFRRNTRRSMEISEANIVPMTPSVRRCKTKGDVVTEN